MQLVDFFLVCLRFYDSMRAERYDGYQPQAGNSPTLSWLIQSVHAFLRQEGNGNDLCYIGLLHFVTSFLKQPKLLSRCEQTLEQILPPPPTELQRPRAQKSYIVRCTLALIPPYKTKVVDVSGCRSHPSSAR